MIRNIKYFSLFIIATAFLWSCSPTRTLTDGEFLVNKNKIVVDNNKISKEDINGFIKQKPNRRILVFFRFHLFVYNYAKLRKKSSKLDSTIRNTVGEPPVILDTLLTNKSVSQIKLYLNSKGYFNSTVNKKIVYKKKKANISYIAHAAKPYLVKTLKYNINDQMIRYIIESDTANCLIHAGKNYDVDVLQGERERITNYLKNDGYFYFAKEFISYEIDSTLGNRQLGVTLIIKDPVEKSSDKEDSTITTQHRRYTIENINIYTDYSLPEHDTLHLKKYCYWAAQRRKTSPPTPYNFLFKDTLHIRPKTITQAVFFKQGDYYRLQDVDQTYNSLMDLKIYKFVSISFTESSRAPEGNQHFLDCKILLTRSASQSFSTEGEATNSAGNLGVASNILYQNKNISKGAEIFKFKISGAMEIQKALGETSSNATIHKLIPFNTFELGADASIVVPKFLLMPVKQERFPKRFRPQTTINTGVNIQKRPDYKRYIVNASYSFTFKESKTKKHIIFFPEISSVKIFPSDTFKNVINNISDPRIRNSYIDHLTMAARYTFIYNNQEVNKNRSFSYIRGTAEVAGNDLRLKNILFHNYQYADLSYTIFNIKYAQYMRGDLELRHYFIFNSLNTIAIRIAGGGGWAYGNSKVLPFEKSFYSGGANSVRAWSIYSLGPGSSIPGANASLDKTGDINIEGNVEYRFPIYSYFKGAFFIDGGNIWLNKKNPDMPGGEFKLDRFYKEFALGTGFGARFDFSFFILRLDIAVPMRDPARPPHYRWILDKIKKERIQFNLGIGYPF